MSNTIDTKRGNMYAVDFDSALGVQIKTYIKRCNECETAIRDFIRTLNCKYSFPVTITDNTPYCLSDDCDAGGLLAIVADKAAYDACTDARSHVLWDAMPSDDDSDKVYLFPRVESTSHYVKYGLAVRMYEHQDPNWSFMEPNAREKAKGQKLHSVTYDEVRNRISIDDRNKLVRRPGDTPSPSVRLAMGVQFKLNDETIGAYRDSIEQYYAEAVALFKEWRMLPSVPANTLARILRLASSRHDGKNADTKDFFCEWRTDNANHRYLIHTGLKTDLSAMQPVDDPSLYNLFGEN